MKAVIPVAGLGTRMLPATKAIPKEMLPVVDKPIIQYVVQEAVAAGITEIVLVTHSSKNSIENHFDTSFELEATLEKREKRQSLNEIKSICPKNVTLIHVRQGIAKGLGHAILCAYPVIGDEPFVVLLPDVLIDQYCSNLATDNLAKMVQLYKTNEVSSIMVEEVPEGAVEQFGIVDLAGKILSQQQTAPIQRIVEKPAQQVAPSKLAVVGRYVLDPSIWQYLKQTPVGIGGEIQLTDAIDQMISQHQVDAFYMQGKSFDCGNKLGYMQACIEYGLQDARLGEDFTAYLQQLNLIKN